MDEYLPCVFVLLNGHNDARFEGNQDKTSFSLCYGKFSHKHYQLQDKILVFLLVSHLKVQPMEGWSSSRVAKPLCCHNTFQATAFQLSNPLCTSCSNSQSQNIHKFFLVVFKVAEEELN